MCTSSRRRCASRSSTSPRRERRLEDCERELALNRRLAPDVYLGVEAVTGHDGDVVDHVVVMQRMPDGARLSSRVDGPDATTCIDALAKVMARFHAAAPTGGAIDAAATRDAVAALWDRELDEYPGPSPEIATAVRRYLAGREALFDARLAAGRARDGHGDLLADDVFCLPDGPRVLDCLEFDDRLRFGDVLADVAFLAMDLERLGRARSRGALPRPVPRGRRRRVASVAGALLRRVPGACARQVAAMSGDDAGARQRLALARDHLDRGRIRLVLVGGAPATGKTTTARAIADATDWALVRSDEVRKALAGIAPTSDAAAPLDQGLYTPEWNDRTYATLCAEARELLARGRSVVLDASWSEPSSRAMAEGLAAETSSDVVALRCNAPVDVAMARAHPPRT